MQLWRCTVRIIRVEPKPKPKHAECLLLDSRDTTVVGALFGKGAGVWWFGVTNTNRAAIGLFFGWAAGAGSVHAGARAGVTCLLGLLSRSWHADGDGFPPPRSCITQSRTSVT